MKCFFHVTDCGFICSKKVLFRFVVTWELDFVRKIMTDNKSGDFW